MADPGLWYKVEVRPDYGHEYYSYILWYVDDILVIHHDSLAILKIIDSYFKLKTNSIGDPDMYIGSKVNKMTLENGTWCWSLSPSKYVKWAIRDYEETLEDTFGGTYKLPKSVTNPFPMVYRPEKDVSKPLGPQLESYYQYLIGCMQ